MGSHLLSDCQNTEEGKCEWVSQPAYTLFPPPASTLLSAPKGARTLRIIQFDSARCAGTRALKWKQKLTVPCQNDRLLKWQEK